MFIQILAPNQSQKGEIIIFLRRVAIPTGLQTHVYGKRAGWTLANDSDNTLCTTFYGTLKPTFLHNETMRSIGQHSLVQNMFGQHLLY